MTRTRWFALCAALAGVLMALPEPGSAAPARRATAHGRDGRPAKAKVTATPRMFRLGHGAGEPTLGITRSGEIFVAALDGCVTSCTGSEQMADMATPGSRAVFASSDEGRTWRNVSPGVGDVSPHVVSMDPYLWVDQHPDGNRVFDIDLTLACSILSFSDDRGASWVTNPLACGEPVNDHQTLFGGPPRTSTPTGYPHVLYYCFNKVAASRCGKSLDGGLTFLPTASITSPSCTGTSGAGIIGHGVVDGKGIAYVPSSGCGRPGLATSTDEGASWTYREIPHDRLGALGDPSVAVDAKGNLYYLWESSEYADRGRARKPWLSTSRDGGTTWTRPMMVALPGLDATNLATLDVGAPGKVAIAYYGTTDAKRGEDASWHGYLASGVDVLGRNPTFYTATVNDPRNPLKIGYCGIAGRQRCGRVLDFIDVEIAPDGQPWGAFVDACATTCETTRQESLADNEGVVASLFGGPNLRK